MKVSLLFLFLFMSFNVIAQNFTGTITYDFKITGPMADQVKGMMQEKQILKIKGNNMRQTIKGGMMAQMMGDIIFLGDKKEAYILQSSEKKALKMEMDEMKNEGAKPKVTKLNEVIDIAGYKCQKYSIEIENEQLGGTLTEYVWATKDIQVSNPKSGMKTQNSITIEGVDGVVLKMVTDMNGMFTLTMIATQVQKGDVPDSEFVIPKDYKIEKFDPSSFGLGGK
ncbi:MAG: hypothetical protein KatS3mg035_1215 [Bacteroidia bacterium]|nr:MAG: hypothetical protein KatS3mg035_1215 [Bacteroidia bacterium]